MCTEKCCTTSCCDSIRSATHPHARPDQPSCFGIREAGDKNRSLGFSPGKLRTPVLEKHCVFQPEEVLLPPPAHFCPPRQECPGYVFGRGAGGDGGLLVCPRHGFSEVWWEFARAEAEATGGFLASIQYLGCFLGSGRAGMPGVRFWPWRGGRCRFTGVSPARVFRVVMGGGPG